MKSYSYLAVTSTGQKVKGIIQAADEKEAAFKMDRSGYTPIRIEAAGRFAPSEIFNRSLGIVPSQELLIFYSQLYDMINAGINFLTSLDIVAGQTQNSKLKDALLDIAARIRKGSSISDALEQHRDIFPDLFISMIRSGEASGELVAVLGHYAALYEGQLDLQKKIAGALFYPLLLLGLGIAVILFLVAFIIPKFVAIFAGAGISLPLPTKILYTVGMVIMRYWYLIAAAIVLAAAGIRRWARTGQGKRALDEWKLLLPVIGPLNRAVGLSRFSHTLGMLLESGVPVISAIKLSSPVMQNVILQRAVDGLPDRMEKGESLSGLLNEDRNIPPNMIHLIAVGEETGNLGGMLAKVAVFYDKMIDNTIKKLTIVIEPFFLVVMGGTISFIMASIIIPLFKMINIAKM